MILKFPLQTDHWKQEGFHPCYITIALTTGRVVDTNVRNYMYLHYDIVVMDLMRKGWERIENSATNDG